MRLAFAIAALALAAAPASAAPARNVVLVPTKASLFSERTAATAWQMKPAYYAVSKQDRTIAPEFERFLARRMNAETIEVDAGHLSMVTHPQEIANLIIRAAAGK